MYPNLLKCKNRSKLPWFTVHTFVGSREFWNAVGIEPTYPDSTWWKLTYRKVPRYLHDTQWLKTQTSHMLVFSGHYWGEKSARLRRRMWALQLKSLISGKFGVSGRPGRAMGYLSQRGRLSSRWWRHSADSPVANDVTRSSSFANDFTRQGMTSFSLVGARLPTWFSHGMGQCRNGSLSVLSILFCAPTQFIGRPECPIPFPWPFCVKYSTSQNMWFDGDVTRIYYTGQQQFCCLRFVSWLRTNLMRWIQKSHWFCLIRSSFWAITTSRFCVFVHIFGCVGCVQWK